MANAGWWHIAVHKIGGLERKTMDSGAPAAVLTDDTREYAAHLTLLDKSPFSLSFYCSLKVYNPYDSAVLWIRIEPRSCYLMKAGA